MLILAAVVPCVATALAAPAPAWMDSKLKPHGLEVAVFPDTGRGLRTTRERAAGDLLLSVDDADALLAERLLEQHEVLMAAAKAAAAGSSGPLTDEQLLALYLTLVDTEYTRSLPPQHTVLSLPDELTALLPRCYAGMVGATQQYAVGLHASACKALEAAGCAQPCRLHHRTAPAAHDDPPRLTHLTSPPRRSAPPVSLETFLWAFGTVRSRSVEVTPEDVAAGGGVAAAAAEGAAAADIAAHPLVAAGGQGKRRGLFPVQPAPTSSPLFLNRRTLR